MIKNIDKIKGLDFIFPMLNAKNAMYKVVSVNELDKLNSTNGNWGAVILAEHKIDGYMVPNHIVFTIEYDTDPPYNTFKITAITSENQTAKIEVSRSGLSTPDKFFETLATLAQHSNLNK